MDLGLGNCWPLQWRHNGRDSISNHQPHSGLLNRLFRRRSKKTSKLRVTGLCAGNSPGTGEFPAQMASNAENVSIWPSHHAISCHLNQHWQKTAALGATGPQWVNSLVPWTLVHVMIWHHQESSHCLSQYWFRSMGPYGITWLQWIDCWLW